MQFKQHDNPILVGPILRHASAQQINILLVCSDTSDIQLQCFHKDQCIASQHYQAGHSGYTQLGEQAHLHLLKLTPEQAFPLDTWLSYELTITDQADNTRSLKEIAPHILYPEQQRPSFVIKSRIDELLHGSCRKPHHPDGDGMVIVDQRLEKARRTHTINEQPALLLLNGDQVYIDDVAGPMLHAIHQVIKLLGLYDEQLEGVRVSGSQALYSCAESYYQRAKLLPNLVTNAGLKERFFGGARKPIFTTANADNHLISLGEMIAMYLLVWSPVLWRYIDLDKPDVAAQFQPRYQSERQALEHFKNDLGKVQRALAHIPSYMIFDDHDITDDWNLTRGWEESAYNQPFSRRIIGNALIAYALFQGSGNGENPALERLLQPFIKLPNQDTETEHNQLITELLQFEGWEYTIASQPKLVVLDTRTRRWRSESNAAKPSGLMDWEALSELQQKLLHEDTVILVSTAPIFGVKLIEVVQRVFTWFGHALTVDAENWMSHPGAANVILNIFRHKRTPHHFVILSGDVHYSFAYDVHLKHRKDSPHIWQISSSGIKNTFPATLLRVFDTLNRWLFASRSPLNWFTRRRHMRIRQRRPSQHQGRYRHQRLVNGCSIGRVKLDKSGAPIVIEVLMVDGQCIGFTEGYESDWVH